MREIIKGVQLEKQATSIDYDPSTEGGLYNENDTNIKAHIEGADREVLTADQIQTVINKSIDADNNTITELEVDNLKAGVLSTDISGTPTDTELASALAIKTYVDDEVAKENEASEIEFDPSSSTLTSTNVQDAIDEEDVKVQANAGNISTNSTDIDNIETKTDFITVTQAVDLDTMESGIATNASDITNIETKTDFITVTQAVDLDTMESGIATNASDITNIETKTDFITVTQAVDLDTMESGISTNAGNISTNSGDITNIETKTDFITVTQAVNLDTMESGIATNASDITTNAGAISDHIADTTDAHAASAITNTPSGNLAATTVQAALNELQTEVDTLAVDSEVVHIAGTEVITGNKSFDLAIQQAELSATPANPASGYKKIYPKDDGKLYTLNSLGTETEVGSGSGGGSGVGDPDTLFVDSGDALEDLSGFTTVGTVTLNETSVINGTKDFKLDHGSALASIEKTFDVPEKFQGKNNRLRLAIKSNASAGNVTITITDETNATVLVNGDAIELLATPTSDEFFFDVPSDCLSLSYLVEGATEASAITQIDDVEFRLTITESTEVTNYVKNENVFGARIANNGTASITSQSSPNNPAIASVTRTGAGYVTVTFTSGYFSVIPAITVTPVFTNSHFSGHQTATTSSVVIYIQNDTGSPVDHDFDLILERQGADYLDATLQKVSEKSTFHEILTASEEVISDWEEYTPTTQGFGTVANVDVLYRRDGSDLLVSGYFSAGTPTATEARVYIPSGLTATSRTTTTYQVGIADTEYKAAGSFNFKSLINSDGANYITFTHRTAARDGITAVNGDSLLTAGQVFVFNVRIPIEGWSGNPLQYLQAAPNSKITLPTSELRFEGSSSRGSTDTYIVKFDTLAKIRGNAFSVVNTAANGTVITMLKDGILSLDSSLYSATGASSWITKNQSDLTAEPIASEVLASDFTNTGAAFDCMASSISVVVGDKIRVATDNTPNAYAINHIHLLFQETEIKVAISNITPQYEDEVSQVRLNTGNGHGSTNIKIRRFSNVVENLGSDISYVDSATLGGTFTVNSDGWYMIQYGSQASGTNDYFGLSLNSTQLTTDINGIDDADRLTAAAAGNEAGEYINPVNWSGHLNSGDIIRAHDNGTGTDNILTTFSISKVSRPSIAAVDITPFYNSNRLEVNSVNLAGNDGGGVTANTENIDFIGSGTGWDSTNNEYTVQENNSIIELSGMISESGPVGAAISVYLNGSLHRYVHPTRSTYLTANKELCYISTLNEFIKDDVISLRTTVGFTLVNSTTSHYLNINESYNSQALVEEVSDLENVFSARIANSGTASITSQSSPDSPAIASVSQTSTGLVAVTFTPGFFSEVPAIVATQNEPSASATLGMEVHTISTTGCTVQTRNSSAAASDRDFSLTLTRQDSDYRDPKKLALAVKSKTAYLKDVKSSGTDGGTFTSGAWQTRTLNTLEGDTSFVSLTSNQFTLLAGKYEIEADAPAFQVTGHKGKIRNITDSTDDIMGANVYSSVASTTPSIVRGTIEITKTTTFELQHRCTVTRATNGYGVGLSLSVDEIYAQVKITKVH